MQGRQGSCAAREPPRVEASSDVWGVSLLQLRAAAPQSAALPRERHQHRGQQIERAAAQDRPVLGVAVGTVQASTKLVQGTEQARHGRFPRECP